MRCRAFAPCSCRALIWELWSVWNSDASHDWSAQQILGTCCYPIRKLTWKDIEGQNRRPQLGFYPHADCRTPFLAQVLLPWSWQKPLTRKLLGLNCPFPFSHKPNLAEAREYCQFENKFIGNVWKVTRLGQEKLFIIWALRGRIWAFRGKIGSFGDEIMSFSDKIDFFCSTKPELKALPFLCECDMGQWWNTFQKQGFSCVRPAGLPGCDLGSTSSPFNSSLLLSCLRCRKILYLTFRRGGREEVKPLSQNWADKVIFICIFPLLESPSLQVLVAIKPQYLTRRGGWVLLNIMLKL